MKLFRKEDLTSPKNGLSGQVYRENILTNADTARALGGLLVVIPPGVEGQLHYHVKRESIQVFLSGEAVGYFTDREVPVKAGDVLFIRPEKNTRSATDRTRRFVSWSSSRSHRSKRIR